jgi:predicted nucleotidyltransferase
VLLRDIVERSPKWARRLIMAGYRGSHAHGTYLPPDDPKSTDDIDVFGIYVREDQYYRGVTGYLRKNDTFTCAGEALDVESHEVRKFVWLLCKGNPNVHSHLWLDPADYFLVSRAARILIGRRQGFLSQKVLASFTGYAYDQLARMAKFEKRGYMGTKREAIVKEHGYDVKNAAHCLRLLYLGTELARTGQLSVKLSGEIRNTVLEVKRGLWGFERVQREARRAFGEFNATRDMVTFPPSVDYGWADETAALTIEAYHEDLEPS